MGAVCKSAGRLSSRSENEKAPPAAGGAKIRTAARYGAEIPERSTQNHRPLV